MFEFTEEQVMIRQMLRRWVTGKLEPRVEALEGGEQPYPLMRDFAKAFGVADMARAAFEKAQAKAAAGDSPQSFSGVSGPDPALGALVSIELTRACPGFMLAFGATTGLAGGTIMSKGTPEQKRRWGLPLITLEKVGGWGMTEPGAGSDAFRSMRTVAVPRDGGYVLNGQKTFITNAPYADTLVIYAKIDRGDGTPLADRPIEAFIVEAEDRGVTRAKPMRKMGMHASPTGEVFLEDCFVPRDRLLGGDEKAGGRAGGKDVFHAERTGMAPMCFGIIERCLEVSTAYAKQRVTWGKPIAEYQLVQDKLARMFVHLENTKNLMFKQIWLTANKKRMNPAEASAVKLYCARAATEVAMEAVQLLGGNGYMQEYRVEMLARDAKLLQIGGGTDEIQIIQIARHILGAAA
jgi:alkylation response protein AidB-like acyl-CoA dehydrogenase